MRIASIALLLGMLLCHGPSSLRAEDDVRLQLSKPLDWQVAQRSSMQQGSVRIEGKKPFGAAVEWRLIGKPVRGTLNDDWTPLPKMINVVDFSNIAAPAGGWYQLQVRTLRDGNPIDEATVAHIGIGEVFLVAGQSNSANYGSEKQKPKSGMVTSFDGKTWRVADDPQPGAGGTGGSFIPAFGDAMADRFHVPIGIVSIGVGSTSVREW
jgi:hypothetical protein